jgi:hypothetical protein
MKNHQKEGSLGFSVEGPQILGVSVLRTLTPKIWEFTTAIPREPERMAR